MKEWDINLNLEEITHMKSNVFKGITKKKAEEAAFVQLIEKKNTESKEITVFLKHVCLS